MNLAMKIISKTLMTKISSISWGVTTKAFTVFQWIYDPTYNDYIKNEQTVGWGSILGQLFFHEFYIDRTAYFSKPIYCYYFTRFWSYEQKGKYDIKIMNILLNSRTNGQSLIVMEQALWK